MRILFVTPYFVPAWSFGGPVKVVYELSKELIRQGHEVTVATTDVLNQKQRHNKRNDTLEGIKIIYFKNLSNQLAYRLNLYFPRGFKKWLRSNIKSFDLIHCHDLFTWLNVIVSRLAPRFQVPFLVQPHGALNQTRRQAHLRTLKSIFLKLYPLILNSASLIITSTEWEKNNEISRLSATFKQKTKVVPNGLSLNQLRPPKPSALLRDKLGFKPKEKFILYFGRIQYIKGLDITLKALALIKDFPVRYVIIGRDEKTWSKLKKLASDLKIENKIIFLGPIFGQDLAEYLATADLFIFNSRSESLPMAVLDACAAGLPVIISPNCNLPEVAESGAGTVLKNNTPEETAQAIIEYFNQPGKQPIMRQKCHQLIIDHFNLEKITKQYLALYYQELNFK
jgi:glycosyltransferase involved in cell wall biosynthesis